MIQEKLISRTLFDTLICPYKNLILESINSIISYRRYDGDDI